MIEIGLYFALGFLIATLLALLTVPAIWRRAVRLTRRQIEATTPLTRAEILADRDQIAAEYAVNIRRFEMGIGALRRRVADHMTTVARQGDQIRALAAERDAARAEIDRLNDRLAAHVAREKGLDVTLDKLEALARDNRRLAEERQAAIDELHTLEARAAAISRDRDAVGDTAESLRYRLHDAESRAEQRLAAVQRQLDSRVAELAEAEKLVAETKAARVEAAARLASGATEIAALRAEREALMLKLAAFQTSEHLAAPPPVEEAETRGDNVAATIDDLERHRAELDRRLGEIVAERDALRARLAEMEDRLAAPPSASDAGFADLRRALTDLGQRFAAETLAAPVAELPPPLPPASFGFPAAPAARPDDDDREGDGDAAPTALPPATFPFAPPGGPFAPVAAPGDADTADKPEDDDAPTRRNAMAESR